MAAFSPAVSRSERASTEDDAMPNDAQKVKLRRLVDDHFAGVWRFLRHLGVPEHLVDDAAQDVFLVAARRFDEILPGREHSFLFGTAFKVAQAARREFLRSRPIDDADVDETVDTAPTPEQQLDEKQAEALALRLLDELDEEQRQVFVLYEIEGLTMQRIAELTNVPMGTVASRLRRAREAFQSRFERHRKSLRGVR